MTEAAAAFSLSECKNLPEITQATKQFEALKVEKAQYKFKTEPIIFTSTRYGKSLRQPEILQYIKDNPYIKDYSQLKSGLLQYLSYMEGIPGLYTVSTVPDKKFVVSCNRCSSFKAFYQQMRNGSIDLKYVRSASHSLREHKKYPNDPIFAWQQQLKPSRGLREKKISSK